MQAKVLYLAELHGRRQELRPQLEAISPGIFRNLHCSLQHDAIVQERIGGDISKRLRSPALAALDLKSMTYILEIIKKFYSL